MVLPSFSWPQAHRIRCGGPLRKATEGEVEPPVQQLADMLAGAGGAVGAGVGAGEGVSNSISIVSSSSNNTLGSTSVPLQGT